MHSFKARILRIVLNLSVIFSIWFVTTLVLPFFKNLGKDIPSINVSTGLVLLFSLLVVVFYFIISVIQDILFVIEELSEKLTAFLHRTTDTRKTKKSIKEFVVAVLLVFLIPFVVGIFEAIPFVGQGISIVIAFIFLGVALALFWSSGKTVYKELFRYTEKISEIVMGEVEESGKKRS